MTPGDIANAEIVPRERHAVTMPQYRDRCAAGTSCTAMACRVGVAAASPKPITHRHRSSIGIPEAAAAGVRNCAVDHTTSPAARTWVDENRAAARPAGMRPRPYPSEKADAMAPLVVSLHP